MKREVMAAARQGTVVCGEPDSTERIRGVANGVRVIAVFRPASLSSIRKHDLRAKKAACHT